MRACRLLTRTTGHYELYTYTLAHDTYQINGYLGTLENTLRWSSTYTEMHLYFVTEEKNEISRAHFE